jgi:hypothetical protein
MGRESVPGQVFNDYTKYFRAESSPNPFGRVVELDMCQTVWTIHSGGKTAPTIRCIEISEKNNRKTAASREARVKMALQSKEIIQKMTQKCQSEKAVSNHIF